MEDTAARCSAHAGEPAVAVCRRCGVFLCPPCALPLEGWVVCGACLAHYALNPEVSARAMASFYLGLAGMVLGFLPGAVGLVLAYRELESIRRGESPPGGRALADAGRLLGWLDMALLAALLFWWLLPE